MNSNTANTSLHFSMNFALFPQAISPVWSSNISCTPTAQQIKINGLQAVPLGQCGFKGHRGGHGYAASACFVTPVSLQ